MEEKELASLMLLTGDLDAIFDTFADKDAPVASDKPDTSTCTSCKIALYAVAGIQIHSQDIGQDCTNRALADMVKMLLLAGKAAGERFGPELCVRAHVYRLCFS